MSKITANSLRKFDRPESPAHRGCACRAEPGLASDRARRSCPGSDLIHAHFAATGERDKRHEDQQYAPHRMRLFEITRRFPEVARTRLQNHHECRCGRKRQGVRSCGCSARFRLPPQLRPLRWPFSAVGSGSTAPGMTCPDWPLCQGEVVPVLDGGVVLEWSHRMVALLGAFCCWAPSSPAGGHGARSPA